jgi:hypothetical protein
MQDGHRIDWRAILSRYQDWRALPTWRKLLWALTRSVTMVLLYVGFAVAILWYNEPALVEGIGAGRASVWALVGELAAQPELLALLLLLVPAIVAAVLLPAKPGWRH